MQELEGKAPFGSPATPHSVRDSWDDPPLTLGTLQLMDNSSPVMDIADINPYPANVEKMVSS